MPRKAGQKQASAGAAPRSDEEILRERRIVENFETADSILTVLSWSLLMLAAVWVLNLDATTPDLGPSLHAGITDAKVCLIACAQFSAGIASCSPKGAWSSWRQAWQAAWSIPLLMIGVSVLFTVGLAANFDGLLGVSCCFGGLAMLLTTPVGKPPKPARGSTAVLGRVMTIADGLMGTIVGIGLLMKSPSFSAGAILCLAITCGPLFMMCSGLLLCSSEAEIQAAVRAVLTLSVGATLQCWWIADQTGLVIALGAFLMHAALYLPLPWKEPDTNPFHASLQKFCRQFAGLLKAPVGGFSHENEE